MTDILTFQAAMAQVAKKPHLLLGNGFSRACRNDIFSYDSLFARADFSRLSEFARKTFQNLDTTDFEVVMRSLRSAATLLRNYGQEGVAIAQSFEADAGGLREVLVEAIAGHHPDHPEEISRAQYSACRSFLAQFDGIYTLNYDLLLYWTLMQDELPPRVEHDDGFRTPDEGPCDYVTWSIGKTNTQNIFYLHGALHLFDAVDDIVKYTWCNTGVRLIEQVRTALTENLYPLFVAEGESRQKYNRIRHSDYLSRGFRSFGQIGGCLFVFGHSLASNDEHVLRCIERGSVRELYISVYGDLGSAGNRDILRRAERMRDARAGRRRELQIFFYDATSAAVWG